MDHANKRYAKLRGLIREKYGTDQAFATAAGLSTSVVSRCLTERRQWRGEEIAATCCALGIPLADAHLYNFFG
jgi:hypothetical protein